MAGLLDLFNSPEGQQALGLLAAGGPVTDPSQTGFGQRLAAASGFEQQWKKRQNDSQMDAMKMQMLSEELALKKLAERRAQGTFDVQQKFLESFGGGLNGGQQTSPMGPGSTSAGTSAPMPSSGATPNGTPMGAEGQKLNQLRIAALLGVPGAKELFDIHKYENSPEELKPGSTYQNRTTGAREFMPLNEKGMLPDPRTPGGVIPQPGFSRVNAQIKGDETAAIEDAKSGRDLVAVDMGDGTTQKMSRADALARLQGGSQQAPQQGFSSADMARIYADAAQRGVTPDIRYTPGAGTFGRTQSPAEQARAVDTAKAEVVQATEDKQKASKFTDFKSQLQIAKTLLSAGPTNSWVGSQVDKVGGLVGYSPSSANLANKLKTVGGWMMQNIPKAPGAQSDAELRDYKVAAGEVGDETVPAARRLASLETVERLITLWEDRVSKGVSNTGGATGDFAEKPKAKAPVPMKGMVIDGYKFKGGVPGDRANWEKQ